MSASGDRKRLVLLVAVAVALGGLLYWDRQGRSDDSIVRAARPTPTSKGVPARSVMATGPSTFRIDDLRDWEQRPLFEPTRRQPLPPPPPPKPAVVAKPLPQPAGVDASTFRLLGVSLGEERAVALVSLAGGQRLVRARQGDVVEGWQVTSVEPRQITLERDSRRVVLQVFAKGR